MNELDLRTTFPERQLLIREKWMNKGETGRRYAAQMPPLPTFIKQCGGKMPAHFLDLEGTQYLQQVGAVWNFIYGKGQIHEGLAREQFREQARWQFHTSWWEHEGHRVYAVDAQTAHAFLNTSIDEFPMEQLRLPVKSFFIRVPRELGWEVSLLVPGYTPPEWDRPVEEHPEPTQELDGFMVTGEYTGATLDQLQIILSGRSKLALEADHTLWLELGMHHTTLGEVVRQHLEPSGKITHAMVEMLYGPTSPSVAEIDRKMLRFILATILYVTSVHPQLKAVEPPPKLSAKATKYSTLATKAAKDRSRYVIHYVGGPSESFRTQRSDDVTDTKRKPPRPHVRSGHFQHVWLGPRDTPDRRSEVRWIQPVQVGSWDRIAAYQAMKGLRISLNKTRPAEVIHDPQGATGVARS